MTDGHFFVMGSNLQSTQVVITSLTTTYLPTVTATAAGGRLTFDTQILHAGTCLVRIGSSLTKVLVE